MASPTGDADTEAFLDETETVQERKPKLSLKKKLSRSLSRSSGPASSDKKASKKFMRRASTGLIDTPGALTMPASHARVARPAFGTVETYKKLEKLGEGTYATVFKGISAVNGKMVALKEIRLEHEEGTPCTAIREVSLLKGLKHANIVTLHDIIHTRKTLTLVFEYLDRDLKQYMDDCGCYIEMGNVKLFLFQLLRGLKFCHSRKVLHRDLKPQNILINGQGELKLADFGLARAKSVPIKTYSNEVVTLWYRPPDVLLGSVEYSTPIDMWGVGCIFYEMISGRPLFPGSTNEDQILHIWKILGTPNLEAWPELETLPDYKPKDWPESKRHDLAAYVPRLERSGVELLNLFLRFPPKARISAADAMKHRYFDELGDAARTIGPTQSLLPASRLAFKPGMRLRPSNGKGKKQRRSSVRF